MNREDGLERCYSIIRGFSLIINSSYNELSLFQYKHQDIKIEIVELIKKVINYRTFEEKFPVGKEIKTD